MSATSDVVASADPHLDDPAPGSDVPAKEWKLRVIDGARRFTPVLAVYGLLKLVGFAVFMWLLDRSAHYPSVGFKLKPIGLGGGARVWDVLGTWDGRYYQELALHWYHPQVLAANAQITDVKPNSAAFFPLYPGLMGLVVKTTGLGPLGAGLLVAIVSSFFAAAGIYAVVSLMGGHRAGVIAGGLWAVVPGSGVEWAVYSDSLFVALAAWACYFTMKRRWITAGVLTLISGLNRPTAAALMAGVGLAALIALFQRRDGIVRPLVAILIMPWGFIGYLLWVGLKMHNLGGYFMIQKSWQHYFDGGKFTLHAIPEIMTGRFHYLWAWPFADTIALITLLAVPCLLILLFRLRPPLVLVVFTLLTIASTTTSQQIFANVPRYLLPAFPLLIALAIAMRRIKWSSLLPMLLVVAVASGWFAGFITFELGTP
jgi:hypothetical protein